jgi:uncharacterized protein (DUF983 family)
MAQHLFTCPHCNEPSITKWAKYWARPHDPAVCRLCNKASSISDAVESASALLYFIAGTIALGIFTWQVLMTFRDDTPVIGPSPITLLLSLLLFYVAVQTAKMFWGPLKALSVMEVEKKKSTSNRIVTAVVIFFFVVLLLEKCGF